MVNTFVIEPTKFFTKIQATNKHEYILSHNEKERQHQHQKTKSTINHSYHCVHIGSILYLHTNWFKQMITGDGDDGDEPFMHIYSYTFLMLQNFSVMISKYIK